MDTGLYDSIIETAVKWLLWNRREHESDIGFSHIDELSERNLWLIQVGDIYSTVSGGRPIYMNFSFNYLYLRYIKKIRHLRRYSKKKDIFMIDADGFLEDLAFSHNVDESIFAKIYKEYYK